ncbi:MAG: metalloregulator ArsR/SmtB family transcription factor [Rikenellaceae bacterium]
MDNTTKIYTHQQEHIARIAKALGHPARIAIMNFLAKQESCFFGEIHEVLPICKATVSQHLTELKNAGLIQGEIIQPKVKYCICKDNWIEAKGIFEELFDSCIAKKECCK